MREAARLFSGEVVHARLRPRPHRLRYRVFSLLLDVDEIDAVAARCRFFSRNRWNVVSFHDVDYGARDGRPVADQARENFRSAGLEAATARIELLAYPRVFGYVFNPLAVYFGYDRDGDLAGVIYEVTNTFGERTSYVVVPGAGQGGVYAHGCGKEMYVSPFTPAAGRYAFRVRPPADGEVLVGVALHDGDGALLRTHFRGCAVPFEDRHLLTALARHPLMTMKVIAAIHWEALRLYVKGVPVVRRHRSPRYSVSWGPASRRG